MSCEVRESCKAAAVPSSRSEVLSGGQRARDQVEQGKPHQIPRTVRDEIQLQIIF